MKNEPSQYVKLMHLCYISVYILYWILYIGIGIKNTNLLRRNDGACPGKLKHPLGMTIL